MWRCVFLLLMTASLAAQTTASQARLDFATKSLPTATLGRAYNEAIKLQNAQGPFQWKTVKGALPQGIVLQQNTGVLSGTPALSGVYKFTIAVQDEGARLTAQREFTLEVQGPLLLEWVKQPFLTENSISGGIKVTNSSTTAESFDLTVIIVAVNETGKAFALGYQHFDLSQDIEQEIPFSSTVPNGRYIVHVDAVAEVAATRSIYRSRLQTLAPLMVSVNR
jgi:hypothetical protein